MASPRSNSHQGLLKHVRVHLNEKLLSAPIQVVGHGNLLEREVFDYDFNQEEVFLEMSNAQLQTDNKYDDTRSEGSSLSGSTFSDGHSTSYNSSRIGENLNRTRSSSEEDVAAAIAASLRDL